MAIQKILATYSVQDADGDRASIPIYGTFDDATATLGSIAAWVAARADDIDNILDAQIVSMGYTIFPTLPISLKIAPNAGSDVEKTGLFTFNLDVSPVRAFGVDVPGFLPSKFAGDLINFADAEVVAFVAGLTPPYGTITPKDERWSYSIAAARKGVKSFRKLGVRP